MHKDPIHPSNIYKAYVDGDSLTDAQVNAGVVIFKDLADRLVYCGPVFYTAFKEANHVYMALEGFQKARQGKR